MSTGMDRDDTDDLRVALAGEIALGLMEAGEVQSALARDPALAAEVARWNERFAALALEEPAATPNPRVLAALVEALGDDARPPLAARDAVAPPARRAEPAPRPRGGLFQSLAFWRGMGAAGLATAAAALFVAFAVPRTVPPEPGPRDVVVRETSRVLLVSAILPKDGPPEYVATYDGARGRLVVVPAATLPSRNGIPFLWLVPNDDGDPVGIGALDPLGTVNFDLDEALVRLANVRSGLVVTLEPAAVQAGGTAQGPVLAHGKFSSH